MKHPSRWLSDFRLLDPEVILFDGRGLRAYLVGYLPTNFA